MKKFGNRTKRKGSAAAKGRSPARPSSSSPKCEAAPPLLETRKLLFRIWDRQTRSFVENSCSLHCFSDWVIPAFSGDPVDFVGSLSGAAAAQTPCPDPGCFFVDGKLWRGARYVPTQYSGVVASGVPVYEGDIVKFDYFVGDMAWVEMGKRERAAHKRKLGAKVGRVRKDLLTNNLVIEVPSEIGTEYYPLEYALGEGCAVVGNIFENGPPVSGRGSK